MMSDVGHVPMPDDPNLVVDVLLQGSSAGGAQQEEVA